VRSPSFARGDISAEEFDAVPVTLKIELQYLYFLALGRCEMKKLRIVLSALFAMLYLLSSYSNANSQELQQLVLQDLQPSRTFAFSQDGNLLAMQSKKEILLFDLRSGRVLRRFAGFSDEPVCFEFTRDNKKILAVGGNKQFKKKGIISFETETGNILNQSALENDFADGCAMSPDGRRFAVTGFNKLEIRDVETLSLIVKNEFQPAESLPREFVFLADGKTIVGASDSRFKIIDTAQMQILKSEPFPGFPLKAYYNRDRSRIIFPSFKNDAVIFDSKSMTFSALNFNGVKPNFIGWVTSGNADSLWAATQEPAALYEFGFDGKQLRKIDVSPGNAWSLFNGQQARAISFIKGGLLTQFDLHTGKAAMLGRYQDSSFGSVDGFLPNSHAIRLDQYAIGRTSILDLDAVQSPQSLPRSNSEVFLATKMLRIVYDEKKWTSTGKDTKRMPKLTTQYRGVCWEKSRWRQFQNQTILVQ